MKSAQKRRLMTILFILSSVSGAAALLFSALGNNMNQYYELKAIAADQAPLNKPINIGGLVKRGSIQRYAGSLKVTFIVTDLQHEVNVSYEGILPDLFRDGQGVLAKGTLIDKNTFIANNILAKHDENYMPKEVREELEASGYYRHAE